MLSHYEQMERISGLILAERRAERKRRNAEIRARNEAAWKRWREEEQFHHVFFNPKTRTFLVEPNVMSSELAEWVHSEKYQHLIVRGKTRAEIVGRWLQYNWGKFDPKANIIQLALAYEQKEKTKND